MSMQGRRRCEFCGDLFRPDPRVGSRQRACSRIECKGRRAAEAKAAWRAENPDYFKGRGVKHKAYRERGSRAVEPVRVVPAEQDSSARTGRDEQDEIVAQSPHQTGVSGVLGTLLGASGEQDAILAQARVLIGLVVAREGVTAEQDELGDRVAMLDNLGRRVLERVARPARTPERAVATLAHGGGPS